MTLAALRALLTEEPEPASHADTLAMLEEQPRVEASESANDGTPWSEQAAANDNAMSEDEARERIEAAWRIGELSWKLDPHQLDVYGQFVEWNERRRTAEYADENERLGAEFDDVFVHEAGRRVGKTHGWLTVLIEVAQRTPGLRLTYATAFQKDIAEIIVPLHNIIVADAPEDLRSEYKGSYKEQHEGLFFPNGSAIKLVGVDMHPQALRGRFSDGIALSEAGFIKNLARLLRSVILPQFQRRPWAFCILESSTPEVPGHDFESVFVPDAKLRGAYRMQTIDDNLQISEREKAKAIRQAGGRGHPTCEREYYCVQTRDPERSILPEFSEAQHVRAFERPAHARAYVIADPGQVDLFGIVFGYWDFLSYRAVIERSWARRNAGTRQVACVIAFYEWLLWGTPPPHKLREITMRRSGGRDGWSEYLVGIDEATPERIEQVHALAQDEKRVDRWIGREAPDDRFTYWGGRQWKQNPASRHSDVALQLVVDLEKDYGVHFATTMKDDADAQRHALRAALGANKLFLDPGAGDVITHFRDGVWNARHTDYERTERHGHFDLLACGVYFWRNLQRDRNPFAPDAHLADAGGAFVQERPAYQTREAAAVANAFGKPGRWQPSGQRWRPNR